MALGTGTRLGPYQIVAPLGAGGMGEVYRARDTKLGRDVAIKVLPATVAADPERLARFQREAEVLAALNHPNIAAIYGLDEAPSAPSASSGQASSGQASSGRASSGQASSGQAGSGRGVLFLVLELVEGEDLAERLKRGAVPVDEVLEIAKQIALALEEAHEKGIVHRDLKPANIKVRPDGMVKLLDFGLAKALAPEGAGSTADTTNSPTLTTPAMTQAGMILGTAAYMSPEQARGKTVDKRADVWAFGAVLFEMLTGKRAFPSEGITDTIVSVISNEPDWPTLPAATPAGLRQLLARCMKKDPKARLQAIGEARAQIEELLSGAPEEMATAASVPTALPAPLHTAPLPVHITQWRRTDSILVLAAVFGVALFFLGFSQTSLAPLSEVTFDRSALRRMAKEYSQRLGAPAGAETAIGVSTYEGKYMSLARQAGAPAARQLTNNPVPYWAWVIQLTDSGFEFDNRGELLQFARNLPTDSLGPIAMPEAQATAERVLQEVFKRAATELEVKRAETDGRVAKFSWRERVSQQFGVTVEYFVAVTSQGLRAASKNYVVPAGAVGDETLTTEDWGVPVWVVLTLIIAAFGLFRARSVEMMTRWRVIASMFALFAGLGLGVLYVAGNSEAGVVVLLSASVGLTLAVGWLFGSVAFESIVRRSDASKLASFASLFGLKALPPACGLAVLRGTLIGLCILGVDAVGVWATTTFLGARLADTNLFFLGENLSGARWPLVVLLAWTCLEAFTIGLLVAFFGAVGERISTRGWARVFAPALLLALGGVHFSMAVIQPDYWTITVLFVDYVLLFFAFRRFDLLTVVTAIFTFAFCSGNYALVVMFRPIGPVEEWAGFVVWGLCVAGAAAVAFQTRLRKAFGRMSAAVE